MTTETTTTPTPIRWRDSDEYGDTYDVTYDQDATAVRLKKRYPTLTRGISTDRLAAIIAIMARGDAGKPWHTDA
jgi:hypothetical protein